MLTSRQREKLDYDLSRMYDFKVYHLPVSLKLILIGCYKLAYFKGLPDFIQEAFVDFEVYAEDSAKEIIRLHDENDELKAQVAHYESQLSQADIDNLIDEDDEYQEKAAAS